MDESVRLSDQVRPRYWQYRLWMLLVLITVSAVIIWLWPLGFSLFGHLILIGWVAVFIGQISSLVWTLLHFSDRHREYTRGQVIRHYLAFNLAILSSVAPTTTLALFRIVFGGGASNVAQMTDENEMGLWMLWAQTWPLLLILNPVSLLIILLTFVCFFRPRKDCPLFVMRICGVFSALIAIWVIFTFFPDA